MTFPNSDMTLSFRIAKNVDFKLHCMSKTPETLLNTHSFFVGDGSELIFMFNCQKETGYLNIWLACSVTNQPIL